MTEGRDGRLCRNDNQLIKKIKNGEVRPRNRKGVDKRLEQKKGAAAAGIERQKGIEWRGGVCGWSWVGQTRLLGGVFEESGLYRGLFSPSRISNRDGTMK